MKKLFAVILSLSLIIAPVPVVHASEGGGTGAYAKQILGLANGIIGTSVVMKCQMASMQWSLMAYMAGSITYIMAEIAGGDDQKKKQSNQSDMLNNVKATMEEGGDYQKATIQAQLDDEKTTLSHVKKRRKWMMAVKVMYGVATALAALELILKSPPVLKDDTGACKSNQAANKGMLKAITAAYAGLSGYAGGGVMQGAIGAGGAFYKTTKFIKAVEEGTEVAEQASIPLINTSIGRLAFFGGALILVAMIDKDLAKQEKDSEKKIADLEKVLKDLDSISKPDTGIAEGEVPDEPPMGTSGGSTGGIQTGGPGQVYEVTKLPDGVELPRRCLSNASGSMDYSADACKKPYKFSRPRFDANLKLPTLVAGANATTDLAQALADGDMGKANVAAGNLNAMAGKLDAVRDDLLKKANDKLKAEGKNSIALDSDLQRQVDGLNSALNKSSAGSGNVTVASLGDAKAGLASTSENLLNESTGIGAGTDAGKNPGATQDTMALPDAGFSGLNEDGLAGSESNSDLDQMLTDRTGKLAALEKMEKGNGEGEIKQDTGTSLFEQVSNRYFLNYSKIFERKKITPPAAPTATPANQ